MAPSADTNQNNDSKAVRDALYLMELFRESPSPILIHIGGYAAKTGAKPNTIIKRLSEIKKRNGLNIVTTTQSPEEYKPTLGGGDAGQVKTKVKKERAIKPAKAPAPHGKGTMKVENDMDDDASGPGIHGLPSPANSPSVSTPNYYLPQKRGLVADRDEEGSNQEMPAKKLKVEA